MYPFADLALARRLEQAEGYACAKFAEAQARLFPERGACVLEHAGAFAAFNGVDSPVTQSFGLGLMEPLTTSTLEVLEEFFFRHGAAADHEVSPLAGVEAFALLCSRGYRPIEISNVCYQPVERRENKSGAEIRVRVATQEDAELWTRINAEGWSGDHPEFLKFLLEAAALMLARPGSICFLAEWEGQPGAAGVLCLHDGVALFGGATTIPELRRRGLQAALLAARLRFAEENGCDLAAMVASAGSNSQRNAERQGFRIAYTRTKWRLMPPS